MQANERRGTQRMIEANRVCSNPSTKEVPRAVVIGCEGYICKSRRNEVRK